MSEAPHVAVVGGGIAGIAAAYEASRAGARVTLFEASDRAGGKLCTETYRGVPVEAGADAFIARDPVARALCDELGIHDELVEPDVFGAYVWSAGGLRKLPPGSPYGIPRSMDDAVAAGLVTRWGALRAKADVILGRRLRGPDVAIGTYVGSRLGREVVARLVDPMLAGTRAGSPYEISLAAGAPQIDDLARRRRSLLLAVREVPPDPPRFATLAGGLSAFVGRILAAVPVVELRTRTRVHEIEDGYRVRVGAWSDHADGIVIAAPAFEAARMLRGLAPDAAADLERIRYASSAVVTLAYPRGSVTHPEDGSGFLVPAAEARTVDACTWYSHKWAHARPPDGSELVRCFVSRRLDAFPRGREEELVDRVGSELTQILDAPEESLSATVRRWERSLPIYDVGHREVVRRIERALATHRALALAGAAYDGSGIPDCIRQGRDAARRVMDALA